MAIADLGAVLRGAPKVELHIHIEGSLEPEMTFALARRNGITLPYADVAALRAAQQFTDLQSFLDLYYACTAVLRTAEDFQDLMLAYLARAAADGVVRAEIFFDPQVHAERGVAMATVIGGLTAGLREGQRQHGVEGALILCFLRHLSEAEAEQTLQQALPFLDQIAGFGLDSGEAGNPPGKFSRVFAACRALGKPVVAHAGEEGPAAYVRDAIDVLGVQRIDHGIRAIEDPALVQRLAALQMPLTVCPLSNQRLQVSPDLREHPLPQLLAAGVCVTVNSDDPAYFGGYLNANIAAVQAATPLTAHQWLTIISNSFQASLRDDAWKAAWQARLAAHFAEGGMLPAEARSR